MKRSIEVFARNRGQNDVTNAWSDNIVGSRKRPAAVDCDFVSASRKARRKLFGERFKTAVPRRNASRPDNGNLHLYSNNKAGSRVKTQTVLYSSNRQSLMIHFRRNMLDFMSLFHNNTYQATVGR